MTFNLFENFEVSLQVVPQGKNACIIPTSIYIVGRGPDGDELFLKHIFVPFLYELVGAANEFQPVECVKLVRHCGAKMPARAARTNGPCVNVVGV